MPFLIGTDEAGYGPNLGPLVVSATVWRVDSLQDDLYTHLRGAIRRPSDKVDKETIVIGDSKELYKPGKGLSGLEQGVFSCLAAVKKRPRTWRTIWKSLAKQDSKAISELPWYRDFDDRLPVELPAKDVRSKVDRLMNCCESAKCLPTQIKSRVICPPKFNSLCEEYGNKASALSITTLELARDVLATLPEDEPAYILCDKHGGRNKYGPLLHEVFPDQLAMVRSEGRAESVYEFDSKKRSREFVFRAKADQSYLPSALASMVSKYLRELAMRAFNEFWAARVEDLKPTAGYPVDARRFKREIEEAQKELGIEDSMLWRSR